MAIKEDSIGSTFLVAKPGCSRSHGRCIIAIVGGKPVDATLEDYSKQIKQKLG